MTHATLISFHDDQAIKDGHTAQLKAHHDADEIIQGKYWENGKGCDTGCSFHSSDHGQWAVQLGIPVQIGRLRDTIFEGLPNARAKEFPLACSMATPVGVNLDRVWMQVMIWLLIDGEYGILQYAETDNLKKSIREVAQAYIDTLAGNEVPAARWVEIRNTAYTTAAIYTAYTTYTATTDTATAAATAAAAAAATYTKATAAAAAAAAAASAAAYTTYTTYTTYTAAAATAAAATAAAAKQNYYIAIGEKLIQLLKEAK
jgi:hypothetical protein